MGQHKKRDIDELLDALIAARPSTSTADNALAVAIYRRLSQGQPVPAAAVAADLGRPVESIDDKLNSWPGVFRDENDDLVGFWGLTTTDMPPHRYEVGGVRLSTWCAWDTLFLTPILATTAHVQSTDALTGEPIALTVTPDGMTEASHPGIVMSFLDPAGRFESDIIKRFCHFVYFFTSTDSGEQWCAKHPGTFLLELSDAVVVGRRYAAPLMTL